jgi:hypothetical protein
MKKRKLLAVCLIGILMAVGLVLAGCGNSNCSIDGDCEISGGKLQYMCHGDNSSECAVNKAWSANKTSDRVKCDC